MSRHVADIDTDQDGWYWVACECGWCNGPFPGPVEAADDFEDHRFAVTARDDYPNIDSIAAGHGVRCLEDAEDEATLALSELDALRSIAMAAWAWRRCKNAQHANSAEESRRHYDSVQFAERHLSEKLDNLIAFAEEDARIRWVNR